MVIFGAGITGCIASLYFNNAKIISEQSSNNPSHKAILRFRSDAISKITGVPFEKIKVQKAIYYNGKLLNNSNIKIQNLYSHKVSGGFFNRSIMDLSEETRWIAPSNFHSQLLHICKNNIKNEPFSINIDKHEIISTVPINRILGLTGIFSNQDFTKSMSKPIYVTHLSLEMSSDVHQTIYYPDKLNIPYRITLQRNKFIIESMSPITINDEFKALVKNSFGIDIDYFEAYSELNNHKQELGKIKPISESLRQDIIFTLTKEFKIYSLGRFATWRNILLDDCVKDMNQIKNIMAKSEYERAIGK